MVLTDAQQNLVLRERRGLITNCMNGWSRNMNYIGEMMLYSSFGVLCQRNEVWYIYGAVWLILFTIRMLAKEHSLSKKEGWVEYERQTWFLLPKVNNSTLLSVVVYAAFIASVYFVHTNGGLEKAAKSLIKK